MEDNINSQVVQPNQPAVNTDNSNLSKNKEIKCGNCNYIGPGEKNRSLAAVVVAWICIIIAPIITLLYFVATHTWRCPNCKSTFVGVKNKKGIYAGQLGGGARWVLIILFVIIGIAIFGLLSSVVLASLNTARTKSQDALIKGEMAGLRIKSQLYADKIGSFKGFCSTPESVDVLKKISTAGASNEYSYICNDNEERWAISNPLKSKGYWCVDSSDNPPVVMDVSLNKQVSCSISNSTTTKNENLSAMRDIFKDEFVNSCAKDTVPRTYCVCVFDKTEAGLGLEGMVNAFASFQKTGKMDERVLGFIKSCAK